MSLTVFPPPASSSHVLPSPLPNPMPSPAKPDFVTLFIQCFQEIVRDSNQRRLFVESDTPSDELSITAVLSQGAWYAVDYFKALQKFKLESRIEKLRKKNAFFHGYASDNHFDMVEDASSASGYKPVHFKIKPNILPSEALQSLTENFSLLDCGTTRYLAAYRALQMLLGTDKFDRLFSFDSPLPFCLSMFQETSIYGLFRCHIIQQESDIKKGDLCYFSSVLEYPTKHPMGPSRGFNVVCLTENPHTYAALGMDFHGINSDELRQHMLDAFNKNPVDQAIATPELWKKIYSMGSTAKGEKLQRFSNFYAKLQMTPEEFALRSTPLSLAGRVLPGKLDRIIFRADRDGVQKLTDVPIDQIRQVFASIVLKNYPPSQVRSQPPPRTL